jgi:hypothetical protein
VRGKKRTWKKFKRNGKEGRRGSGKEEHDNKNEMRTNQKRNGIVQMKKHLKAKHTKKEKRCRASWTSTEKEVWPWGGE